MNRAGRGRRGGRTPARSATRSVVAVSAGGRSVLRCGCSLEVELCPRPGKACVIMSGHQKASRYTQRFSALARDGLEGFNDLAFRWISLREQALDRLLGLHRLGTARLYEVFLTVFDATQEASPLA